METLNKQTGSDREYYKSELLTQVLLNLHLLDQFAVHGSTVYCSITVSFTEHRLVGEQHAKLLRSRSTNIQEAAMQNIIALAYLRLDEFDLTPAVPELLTIYEFDRNEQRRIMAVAALRAVGEKYGMNELYLLSERESRASPMTQFAQYAVKHYYTQEAMEHEEARSASYLARGDVEKAEKHALRAAAHRSKLG